MAIVAKVHKNQINRNYKLLKIINSIQPQNSQFLLTIVISK